VPPETSATLLIVTLSFCPGPALLPGLPGLWSNFHWTPPPLRRHREPSSDRLEAHGDTHAATDAKGRQPPFGASPLHFEYQRVEDARTRGADRVADGDRAAIDIDD